MKFKNVTYCEKSLFNLVCEGQVEDRTISIVDTIKTPATTEEKTIELMVFLQKKNLGFIVFEQLSFRKGETFEFNDFNQAKRFVITLLNDTEYNDRPVREVPRKKLMTSERFRKA